MVGPCPLDRTLRLWLRRCWPQESGVGCCCTAMPTGLPMLKWILLAGTVVGAILVLVGAKDRFRKLAVAGLILGSLAGITGSASYAIATAATAHGGSIPTAGPTGAVSDSGMGGGGGMGGGPELQNGDAPPNSSDATVKSGVERARTE